MKKLLAIAAGMLVLTSGAALAGGPAPKSTGDVGWSAFGVQRYAEFNAHGEKDGRAAKGSLRYWDDNGAWFTMEVSCYFENSNARFGGTVTDASNPAWIGMGRWWKVADGGTPGSDGDTIGGQFETDAGTACAKAQSDAALTNGGPFDVNSGNLVIH